jgi:hypothetical protein
VPVTLYWILFGMGVVAAIAGFVLVDERGHLSAEWRAAWLEDERVDEREVVPAEGDCKLTLSSVSPWPSTS